MPGLVERILGRDRWLVIGLLVAIFALAAGWTLRGGATGMSAWDLTVMTGPPGALIAGLPDMAMGHWTWGYALVIFLMWWLMMAAMMLPSAAPVILLHAALSRERGIAASLQFLAGYLAIWGLFSALATGLQAGMVGLGGMSGMFMTLSSPWLAAGVLVAAGLYQLTPLKSACLRACRGPVEAITRLRRSGPWADLRMGLLHGRDCLGCCWAMMALLFVGGVMNLWWIAGLALMIGVEKLALAGERLSRALGGVFLVLAAFLIARTTGWA